MKYEEVKYFEAVSAQASTVIDFASLHEFCRYAEAIHAKLFFKLTAIENEIRYFGILQDSVLLRLPTNGYQNLYDYIKGQKHLFPSAEIFYKAQAEGYVKYEEYKMVIEAGIASHDVFEKVKSKGFIIGFTTYNDMLAIENTLPEIEIFLNPYQLYLFAEQNSFEDFAAFKTALLAGFTNADTAKAAKERGFSIFCDYDEAIKKGYSNFTELEIARKAGVKDRTDFLKFKDLEKVGDEHSTHDKKLLLVLLSKIEQGKKISINKLIELHNKYKEEYQYPETAELPSWFTISLNGPESIIEFFLKNEATKKYGEYDMDGEFFQINRMQDRKVVIDGSNRADA